MGKKTIILFIICLTCAFILGTIMGGTQYQSNNQEINVNTEREVE